MRYFLDTEFIEGFRKPLFGKKAHFIELISIGVYREDGKSLYILSSEYDYKGANDWVKKNVIAPAYVDMVHGDQRNYLDVDNFHKSFGKTKNAIAGALLDFFGCGYEDGHWYAPDGIEVYGYYADYDWVLFCSLFGTMMDLPKRFPMYCRDLKQTMDEKVKSHYMDNPKKAVHTFDNALAWLKDDSRYPKQTNEHNALADAKWNYQLYKFLQTL